MRRAIAVALIAVFASLANAAADRPLPAVKVADQRGQVFTYPTLVRGKTSVVAFLFTGCSSTCPIIGRRLAQVMDHLAARAGRDIEFIGLSVDPLGDSLAARARFSDAMGLRQGWHFINGPPESIEQLRNVLGGGGPLSDHVNYLLVTNHRTGVVSRIDATRTDSATIAARVAAVADTADARATSTQTSTRAAGTARYFSAGTLLTSDNRSVDFYRDVLGGRIVLIDTLFSRCADACPLITRKLAQVKQLLGSQADRVRFVSVSNDPRYDTPARLAKFGKLYGVGGDWVLLTGAPADVQTILAKLNLAGAGGADHSTALIIGNDVSGSWRRVSPAVSAEELVRLLRAVIAETPG